MKDMQLGDIIEVQCDFDGHPVEDPSNCSFTIKRKFKIIGINNDLKKYVLELHYSSPFGIKASSLNLDNFKLIDTIDSTDLPLIKAWIISESSLVKINKSIDSGINCMHCDDYYPYANSNRKDGKFLCYSCRSSVNWKYPNI